MKRNIIPELMTQNIGEVDLPYLSYGSGGQTLILLHATGFLSWLWHPIARDLSPIYRVIIPNIVDYRQADPESGGLPWMTIARDIFLFCKKKHIENPFLVGHSMGGTVLALAVAQYGINAKAMILIEPIFLSREIYRLKMTVEDHPLASKALKRLNSWRSSSEAMTYLKSKPLFAKWNAEILKLYIDYGMKEGEVGVLRLVCSPRAEATLFMGGLQLDPWPLLPKITCPVLVIEGEKSENKHFVNLNETVSVFSQASRRVVIGAGHLIPMERPGETTAIIREFFRHLQKT